MSDNRDLDATWKYHNGTKHSYLSIRLHPHELDWDNKPLLFKIYPTLEVLRLPKDLRPNTISALSAIANRAPSVSGEAVPSLDDLAQLLYFSAGVTRSKKYPGGETFFRAAACTGALYEIELYVVCQDLPGLAAGVYHFGAAEFGLRQLRAGDYRRALVEASGDETSIADAPVILLSTGTYWRNAWKYRSRTYRHFGWDNGTILANMLAMSNVLQLPSRLVLGYEDDAVNRLLGLDVHREVVLSMISIGRTHEKAPVAPASEPLDLPVVPYSKQEVDYPAMRQMHAASSLQSAPEAAQWRAIRWSPLVAAIPAEGQPLEPLPDPELPTESLENVIQRRGSTRRFAHEAISFGQLSTMLRAATAEVPRDFFGGDPSQFLNDIYLSVHSVDGLKPGAYFFSREHSSLALLKEGDFRKQAGYLGLEQALPADASVDIFFLADLQRIVAAMGNRGYRTAQLEAGIIGGRLYLAAYAQRLGASGLTFYDDDVVNFFAPHAKGKSAIFLVTIGHSFKS